MSWREKVQWAGEKGKASFRGAAFFIDESETQIGRRIQLNTPGGQGNENSVDAAMGVGKPKPAKQSKEFVWADDLGPDADEFKITGYVVQNLYNNYDYFKERDKLITALKTSGPGELVHPLYGKHTVSLKERAKISESLSKETGIARFEMVFMQHKKPIFKQQEADYVEKIDKSALSTINSALDGFTNLMNIAGSFLNTLVGPVMKTMNKIQGAINSIKGAVASTINTALSTVSSALSLVDNLISSPCDLANQIIAAGQAVKNIVGMAGEIITGGVVGGCSGETRGDTTVMGGTSTSTKESTVIMDGTSIPEKLGVSVVEELSKSSNYNETDSTADNYDSSLAITTLPTEQQNNLSLCLTVAQVGMITTAVQIAIRIDFSNQDDMENTVAVVTESIDNLIDRLGSVSNEIDDPLLFQNICQLRSDFIDSMYKKNTGLAKQITYTVPTGIISALELAYNEYGDIGREEEIFLRNWNEIKHPGFLPNGENIRILSE
jgi:prophage DNA circulation protein